MSNNEGSNKNTSNWICFKLVFFWVPIDWALISNSCQLVTWNKCQGETININQMGIWLIINLVEI